MVITPSDEAAVTVGHLDVAQFISLLLHNEKIREVIDTIGKKGVLILGRFSEEVAPTRDLSVLWAHAHPPISAALELWRRGFPLQAGILR